MDKTESGSSNRDPILESIRQAVQLVRANSTANKSVHFELEFRLGQFSNADGRRFFPGFPAHQNKAFHRLRKRLLKNCEKLSNWRVAQRAKQWRSWYTYQGHEVRRIVPSTEPVIRKRPELKTNFKSSRDEYSVRLAVNREIPIQVKGNATLQDKFESEAPNKISFYQRISFVETVTSATFPLEFRYDLTKVSPPGDDKKKSTDKKCTYQVELELASRLQSIEDNRPLEFQQDNFIAFCLLARVKALLGTTRASDNSQRLPSPTFSII